MWLDAPIGYIASYANLVGNLSKAEKQWNQSRVLHFIGKDITYFHLLFWPAMLLGSGFTIPESVKVHGFLTVNGEKMSKSRGTFFTAEEFVKNHDPEHLRYYYASNLSKRLSDIDLNFDNYRDKVNNELVASLGNFCYRVTSFINRNFKGEIKDIDNNKNFQDEILKLIPKIAEHYESVDTNEAVRSIMHISDLGNRYFQENEPWKLIKSDKDKVQKICGLSLNIVKNLSILISPILPNFSKELQKQINLKDLNWNDIDFKLKNHKIRKEKILVEKIEEEKQVEKFPLNLKVAKILEVKDHPDADKLYVLQIDLGAEKRQLVAGLKGHYSKEELKNKKIIVLTNLKYAKLRGIESQGMLLAGEDKKNVGILTLKDAQPGTQVGINDLENSNEQLTFEQFSKLKIIVKDSKPYFEGKEIKAGSEIIKVEKVKDGARVR